MLETIKEFLTVIREALITLVVLFVLFFPAEVGAWLAAHGVQKFEVAGATVDLAQFKSTREALNAVTNAANSLQEQPRLRESLETAAGQLSQSLAGQVRALSKSDPNALPHDGWMYLGTLNSDK